MDTTRLRQETLLALQQFFPVGSPPVSTERLAEALCIKSQTLRRGYCVNGHYLGLIPIKLGNRRLLWPVSE